MHSFSVVAELLVTISCLFCSWQIIQIDTNPGLCTGPSTMFHQRAHDIHLVLLGSNMQSSVAILQQHTRCQCNAIITQTHVTQHSRSTVSNNNFTVFEYFQIISDRKCYFSALWLLIGHHKGEEEEFIFHEQHRYNNTWNNINSMFVWERLPEGPKGHQCWPPLDMFFNN